MISDVTETQRAMQPYSVGKAESLPADSFVGKESCQRGKRDEYVPGCADEPIGLYKVSLNESGKKEEDVETPEPSPDIHKQNESEDTSDTPEICRCDTNSVDSEIKRLKEKQRALSLELQNADASAAGNIQKQLDMISRQLALKDNDSYHRENAVFS